MDNKSTTKYPLNPNGSSMGVAAISSLCGRHLAIMPHPERSYLKWQLPWIPRNIEYKMRDTDYSPWFQMFINVRRWMDSVHTYSSF